MFNLDPGKLLVIAVVAIILLGPDRLPQVARQIGGAWKSFNEFRHRVESEVRNTVPDLPPTSEIARLARSPSALLHHLSTMSEQDEAAAAEAAAAWEPDLELPDAAPRAAGPVTPDPGTMDRETPDPGTIDHETPDPGTLDPGTLSPDTPAGATVLPAAPAPQPHPVPPTAGPAVAGDPTLN